MNFVDDDLFRFGVQNDVCDVNHAVFKTTNVDNGVLGHRLEFGDEFFDFHDKRSLRSLACFVWDVADVVRDVDVARWGFNASAVSRLVRIARCWSTNFRSSSSVIEARSVCVNATRGASFVDEGDEVGVVCEGPVSLFALIDDTVEEVVNDGGEDSRFRADGADEHSVGVRDVDADPQGVSDFVSWWEGVFQGVHTMV